MTQWFEEEKFWLETYDSVFPAKKFEEADGEVEQILKLVGHKGGPALDLCCGPGRHLLALAKRGIAATGVDRTAFLLAKARQRLGAEGLTAEFHQTDMRDFVQEKSFDLVLSMFTSFGYFADKDDDLKVLRNIQRSLRPGGSLVIDIVSKEIVARVFKDVVHVLLPSGAEVFETREIVDDWTRIRGLRRTIGTDGSMHRHEFEHRIYSAQELKDLMLRAEFSTARAYGGFDGSPYDDKSQRLVVVGVR